jgi:CDP-glycerol glycerophosphotransferase (TagB/SpsB family)
MSIERLTRRPSGKKRFLNVWHGMPVKNIDLELPPTYRDAAYTIATSPLHARTLSQAWKMPAERVRVTGLPRNDRLLSTERPARTPLQSRNPGANLAVWLPTYRSSVYRSTAVDGAGHMGSLQAGDIDAATVDELLDATGWHILVKTHPLAPPPDEVAMKNMSFWSDDDLAANDISLYALLAESDALITDYSSVWIDYLITGKPMIFILADLAEYKSSRGVYFDHLEELLPGPIVSSATSLVAALADAPTNASWKERRDASQPVHHQYVDDGSALRVAHLAAELLACPSPRDSVDTPRD